METPKINLKWKPKLKNITQQENYIRKLKQIQKQKPITLTSLDDKINRQIDYIMINQRFRNCTRRAQTITGRKANMHQENNITSSTCIYVLN